MCHLKCVSYLNTFQGLLTAGVFIAVVLSPELVMSLWKMEICHLCAVGSHTEWISVRVGRFRCTDGDTLKTMFISDSVYLNVNPVQ